MRFKLTTGAALVLLGGCYQMSIENEDVFAPPETPYHADSIEEMKLNRQAVFQRPMSLTYEVPSNGEDIVRSVAPEDFVAATVQHGFLSTGKFDRIAWTLITRGDRDRPLVVHCGGNSTNRYNSGVTYALKVLPFGDVFLFDYPGYGDSSGVADAPSFQAAALSLSEHIAGLDDGRDLVFWGHSLGGFVCANLAGNAPGADAVILEATARNAVEVAHAWTPWWASPFVRINVADGLLAYDSADVLKNFSGPILVLGGAKDDTLQVELSRSLVEALTAKGADVTYVEFPDGAHNNLPDQGDFADFTGSFFVSLSPE